MNNRANFFGEKRKKKLNEAFQGVFFFRTRAKTFESNLVFVVVLFLKSKALH